MCKAKQADLKQLAKELVFLASEKHVTLATAESCTGGMIAASMTSTPGSSAVFMGSVVSYSNTVKADVLMVNQKSLDSQGAVSEIVALQMAKGATKTLKADIAVSTTGIAGPDGGSKEKPVGLVWIAINSDKDCFAQSYNFVGDRDQIRNAASEAALEMLSSYIRKKY